MIKTSGRKKYSWACCFVCRACWWHKKRLSGYPERKSPVAEEYGVRAIPQNFLLDREGRIIAKNLRGEELDNPANNYTVKEDHINHIIRRYENILAENSAKARRLIQQLDYRNNPMHLQRIAQTYLDECRFHDDGTQRDKILLRKWRMAEKYAIMAFKLDSRCLMVLSMMGKVRKSGGQDDIAIFCFEEIIIIGAKAPQSACCRIDRALADEVVNDARFELYRLHFYTDHHLARKFLREYKKGLKKGISTIYAPLHKFLPKDNRKSLFGIHPDC